MEVDELSSDNNNRHLLMTSVPQQISGAIHLFTGWSEAERKKLFEELLQTVVIQPQDDGLLGAMNALMMVQPQPKQSLSLDTREGQISIVLDWMSGWSDTEKNILINELENIDQSMTYWFYDKFAKLRWR